MKRFIALLLLFCVLLTGCSIQSSDSPNADTTESIDLEAGNAVGELPPVPFTAPVCKGHTEDPYTAVDKDEFYANYVPACCYTDATYRTQHFLLSGLLSVPGQYVTAAEYQPSDDMGVLIRNTDSCYLDDGNTYVIVDAYGREVLRIYKGAAYITLEELAAYMYAFGGSNENLPANYNSKKNTKVGISPWGIYLRINHSYFSGNTEKYPYEPVLPDISGCGGDLQYYEMDIGTTGTDTGNGYAVRIYNDGTSITRGAARLVYTRTDKNRNGIYEANEVYVFYTANHYNDFREYLNYYGGWGQIFGNETGGGTISSKSDYNPTPYIATSYASFNELHG